MTHDELLAKLADDYQFADYAELRDEQGFLPTHHALRSVVELHKQEEVTLPDGQLADICSECSGNGYYSLYPCPTIQAIEKELV